MLDVVCAVGETELNEGVYSRGQGDDVAWSYVPPSELSHRGNCGFWWDRDSSRVAGVPPNPTTKHSRQPQLCSPTLHCPVDEALSSVTSRPFDKHFDGDSWAAEDMRCSCKFAPTRRALTQTSGRKPTPDTGGKPLPRSTWTHNTATWVGGLLRRWKDGLRTRTLPPHDRPSVPWSSFATAAPGSRTCFQPLVPLGTISHAQRSQHNFFFV